MTYTRVTPINLYDDVWAEPERDSVIGQEAAVTLDGNIVDDNPRAVIHGVEYEEHDGGHRLVMDVALPPEFAASDFGGDSPHPVTVGYVRGADGVIRVHTISRPDQVPEEDPMPLPPGYEFTDNEGAPEVTPSADGAGQS